MDIQKLKGVIYERTGIAIDEKDPIMAVLVASDYQTEQITIRLLKKTILLVVIFSFIAAAIGAAAAWYLAEIKHDINWKEWVRVQNDPKLAVLIHSEQGRAAVRLAELGVASALADCSGRKTWKVIKGYCVPTTQDGKPDGFRVE